MRKSKFNPDLRYKLKLRAKLCEDKYLRGTEMEDAIKEFEKRFEKRNDIEVYYMVEEIKNE